MTVPFTRKLGARSGIQLNPIIDGTERFVGGNADQTVAIVGKFERGRIDRAFRVNRNDLYRKLGTPSSLRVSLLNEAFVQLYESFQAGTYEAVVYRLHDAATVVNKYVTVALDELHVSSWSLDLDFEATPIGGVLAVKHLECFNDGIIVEINAVKKQVDNSDVAATDVKVRLKDKDGTLLFGEFEGSLLDTAKDEFGKSTYIVDVIQAQTDLVEVIVFATSVHKLADFYGVDTSGRDKWSSSGLVKPFTEGSSTYDNTDLDAACSALKYGDHEFGMIIGGGTQDENLLSRLLALGIDINKQFLWDVPGDLSPDDAIIFYNNISVDSHYSQCYWSPLLHTDPVNGGKAHIGKSGQNAGMRCARNAITDANGFAPKNFVVAGKKYPITSTGIKQTYTPSEFELDRLAKARINPVIFIKYNTGSRYVFADSLTGAKTEADRKLIAVADMSSQIDDWVAAFAQEALQQPMKFAVKQTQDFLQQLLDGAQTANWLTPSDTLDGRAFVGEVKPNAQRPSDRMDVSYWNHYDGTVRAIYVQQTISK